MLKTTFVDVNGHGWDARETIEGTLILRRHYGRVYLHIGDRAESILEGILHNRRLAREARLEEPDA